MIMAGMPRSNTRDRIVGIFPESVYHIVIRIGSDEYIASSFDDLISLPIDGKTLPDIMNMVEVQYY